jgi:hypothetical protein
MGKLAAVKKNTTTKNGKIECAFLTSLISSLLWGKQMEPHGAASLNK